MPTSCDLCIYAVPEMDEDGEPMMKCHRYPPVVLVLDGEAFQTRPDADGGCGEYDQGHPSIKMSADIPTGLDRK